MTLRRKIAGVLRRLASRIDDTPRVTRAEIDAQIASGVAIPRRVNRYVEKAHFSTTFDDAPIVENPLAVKCASDRERQHPGLYAGNPDMEAAIARHRALGGE
jgi:hypothetical protein